MEVRENGGRVAPLSALSWEIRGSGQKPLLHLWSEQYNLTRRILVSPIIPALRFHPSTDIVLRYLTREIEVVRVGAAESWRRGLRVVLRH